MLQRHLPCFHLKGIVYLNVYAKYDVSVLYTKVATDVKIDNRNNDKTNTDAPDISIGHREMFTDIGPFAIHVHWITTPRSVAF